MKWEEKSSVQAAPYRVFAYDDYVHGLACNAYPQPTPMMALERFAATVAGMSAPGNEPKEALDDFLEALHPEVAPDVMLEQYACEYGYQQVSDFIEALGPLLQSAIVMFDHKLRRSA